MSLGVDMEKEKQSFGSENDVNSKNSFIQAIKRNTTASIRMWSEEMQIRRR